MAEIEGKRILSSQLLFPGLLKGFGKTGSYHDHRNTNSEAKRELGNNLLQQQVDGLKLL
jgi:hypothetical protein